MKNVPRLMTNVRAGEQASIRHANVTEDTRLVTREIRCDNATLTQLHSHYHTHALSLDIDVQNRGDRRSVKI